MAITLVSDPQVKIAAFAEAKQELEHTLSLLLISSAKKAGSLAPLIAPYFTYVNAKLNKYKVDPDPTKIDKALTKIRALNEGIRQCKAGLDKIHAVIIEEDFLSGFAGVPLGICYTSDVHRETGVSYAGIPIAELQNREVEQIFFLLDHRRLPSDEELENYKQTLQATATTPMLPFLVPSLENPMECLSATLLGLCTQSSNQVEQDALFLRAHMPFIVASVINTHAGWGATPNYDPRLNYVENFAHMLQMPDKNEKQLADFFRLFLILHCDHGGGNLSTIVAKSVASGGGPLALALGAGMIALSTPAHGGANRNAFEFVNEAQKRKNPEELIHEYLDQKKPIPGCGHRVLRNIDARATVLSKFCKEHFPEDAHVQTAIAVYDAAPSILLQRTKTRNPYPNVDAFSGTALNAVGFRYPQYFTVLFGLARMSGGIIAQIVDERKAKLPLFRPDYIYRGPGAEEEQKITPSVSVEHFSTVFTLLEQLKRVVDTEIIDSPGIFLDHLTTTLNSLFAETHLMKDPEKSIFQKLYFGLEKERILFAQKMVGLIELQEFSLALLHKVQQAQELHPCTQVLFSQLENDFRAAFQRSYKLGCAKNSTIHAILEEIGTALSSIKPGELQSFEEVKEKLLLALSETEEEQELILNNMSQYFPNLDLIFDKQNAYSKISQLIQTLDEAIMIESNDKFNPKIENLKRIDQALPFIKDSFLSEKEKGEFLDSYLREIPVEITLDLLQNTQLPLGSNETIEQLMNRLPRALEELEHA